MLSDKTFTIRPLPSIVFGVDCSLGLAGHVRALGRRCAMVVTDPGPVRAGVITPLLDRMPARDGFQHHEMPELPMLDRRQPQLRKVLRLAAQRPRRQVQRLRCGDQVLKRRSPFIDSPNRRRRVVMSVSRP